MTPGQIRRHFTRVPPPDKERAELHEEVRGLCGDLAAELVLRCPPGRERAVALTKVEEAMFWANAGIARGEDA